MDDPLDNIICTIFCQTTEKNRPPIKPTCVKFSHLREGPCLEPGPLPVYLVYRLLLCRKVIACGREGSTTHPSPPPPCLRSLHRMEGRGHHEQHRGRCIVHPPRPTQKHGQSQCRLQASGTLTKLGNGTVWRNGRASLPRRQGILWGPNSLGRIWRACCPNPQPGGLPDGSRRLRSAARRYPPENVVFISASRRDARTLDLGNARPPDATPFLFRQIQMYHYPAQIRKYTPN